MRRLSLAVLISFGLLSAALAADTPGEVAVKDAIKTLKEKRAAVKDKADQALLDTAIKDLEERLAQVGKVEPEPEEKKVEAFVMPKGWELKFNTGKTRPTYNPKTGELKLVYDFFDAKQLKDFEYDKDFKPTVQKGILTVKGGEKIQHVVRFLTASVSCDATAQSKGDLLSWDDKLILYVGDRKYDFTHNFDISHGGQVITGKGNTPGDMVANPVAVKNFQITPKKAAVTMNGVEVSAAIKDGKAGQLIIQPKHAPNHYKRLELVGALDPEWAKEFFADNK